MSNDELIVFTPEDHDYEEKARAFIAVREAEAKARVAERVGTVAGISICMAPFVMLFMNFAAFCFGKEYPLNWLILNCGLTAWGLLTTWLWGRKKK